MRPTRVPLLTCCLLVILVVSSTTMGQEKPTLTPDDYGKWESLGSQAFSPDGKWMTWNLNRVNGENELRIHSLTADSTKIVEYGSRPTFSEDSNWLAYSIGYSEDEREQMEKAKKPIRNRMGLFNLITGETARVDEVSSFAFRDNGGFITMRRYPAEGRESAGTDLVVRDLTTGIDTNFGNISEFAWQDEGDLLAMIIDAEGKAGNGVQTFDPTAGILQTLVSADAVFKDLTWREESADLAALRVSEDEDHEDATHVVVVWKGLDARRAEMLEYDHRTDPGFPVEMGVVDMRSLSWSDDGSALFFGIKEWESKPDEVEETESDEEETTGGKRESDGVEPANVEIWHASDVSIWPEQSLRASRNRQENFLSVWHIDSGRFVQLGSDLTEDVTLIEGDALAIGIDETPYKNEGMFGPVFRDIYVIDVTSGERNRIKSKVEYFYGAGPAGRYLLYLEDDHYYTYDLESGTHTNITRDVPAVFVNLKDDHTVVQKPPFRYAGWTEDDRSILLYDEYDIWEVRTDGSRYLQLTTGTDERIRHRYQRLDQEEEFIDLSQPMYLNLYGEWTKKSGFGLKNRQRPVEQLLFLDMNVQRLVKASEADVYSWSVQNYDDSPDLFVGGPDMSDARQVSSTNAFQSDYAWGRSELVDFENAHGQALQGALFYPANYEPGKQYPMIVYIYEIVSNGVHRYTTPSELSPYNTTVFTQNGYFLFQPDIVYRDRNPGLSSVECVVPAVEKVLETGMIDRERIGLVGHSWGAYQTAFIVTQTELFAAGIAGAPLTDLISMYLSIYWNSGSTDARIFEISQGRMEVPPWEDLDAYMQNSALFNIEDLNTPLLVAFGDKDGAVDWHQGIELYNAARREEKDYVMLVYPGENHSLRQKPNQIDYHDRILQWFGHYLRGDEAEQWITEGVSLLDREKEVEKAKKNGGGGL
ncbi:prolyl oligopeptidase family serine peptidase [Gemmatimonadota bacterium]